MYYQSPGLSRGRSSLDVLDLTKIPVSFASPLLILEMHLHVPISDAQHP